MNQRVLSLLFAQNQNNSVHACEGDDPLFYADILIPDFGILGNEIAKHFDAFL